MPAQLQDLLTRVTTEDAAVADLLGRLAAAHPPTPELHADPDAVPEPLPQPVSQHGDCWTCGPHRVWCGDARDGAAVAALFLDGPPAGCGPTRPTGSPTPAKRARDSRSPAIRADGLEPLLRESFHAADAVLAPGAPIFVAHPAGPQSLIFGAAFGGGSAGTGTRP